MDGDGRSERGYWVCTGSEFGLVSDSDSGSVDI